jgi:hypothetical protein
MRVVVKGRILKGEGQMSKAKTSPRLMPDTFFYSPHIPRRGAPHGHGPGSAAAASRETPDTANTDNNLSTRGLEQARHTTWDATFETIFSNFAPHSWHRYSKMGMRNPQTSYCSLQIYRKAEPLSSPAAGQDPGARLGVNAPQPHFFWLFWVWDAE